MATAAASPILRATGFALLATVSFACVNLSVRALSLGGLPTVEIVFLRSAVSLLALAPWVIRAGTGALRTSIPHMHLLRGIVLGIGTVMWFQGLGMLPLGDAMSLQFTTPLWVAVLAALLLRERVTPARWAVIALGFAGVLVIIRPGMGGAALGIGALLVLGGAAFYGCHTVIMKPMARTEGGAAMVFYLNSLYFIVFGCMMPFFWVMPGWNQLGWLTLLGIAGALSHVFLTRALHLADASFVAPFDFLKLPFGATMAFFLFGDVSDTWTWIGAAIIIAAGYMNARAEGSRRAKEGGGG
jgi:drug/metabolite transporter (DMT)-like permease